MSKAQGSKLPPNAPYNINRWGKDYVSISEHGDLEILLPGDTQQRVSFNEIAKTIHAQGLRLPTLVRFKSVLHDRVNRLVNTFNDVIEEHSYQGRYQVVYPIKVNQQKRVVEEIVAAEPARANGQVGLEAGSKPELLAVLALALEPGATIICNGYKDREYIRTALLGQLLGYKVHIVIEKQSELPLIIEEASKLKLTPRIGLRARLNSIGKGKWQNTGGEKSKFGLSSSQILETLNFLKEQNALASLSLLHFHLGSQIANIRDIQNGLQECAIIYARLRELGAPIDCVDIGGGLGIDYDGTESRNVCSVNYQVRDYARKVVEAFADVCSVHDLPQPNLISESGRALTAHHAVLLADVVAKEKPNTALSELPKESDAPSLQHLLNDFEALQEPDNSRSLIEIYHDAKHAIDDIHSQFIQGNLALEHQALAETLYLNICQRLRDELNPSHRDHRELIDELNEKLAEKLFVNFSLFQSTPDIWGIDQIFPIVPISNLHQPLDRRAIIQDITCDSDGRIDHYVSNEGLETSLRLPPQNSEQEVLCFFLIGAYQEILGDMHNLFGDTDSVDISIDEQGRIQAEHATRGDTVAKVLEYVNLSSNYLLENYRQLLVKQGIEGQRYQEMMHAFESGLASYTYLG